MTKTCSENWNVEKARKFYNIPVWGDGYFDINNRGRIIARLDKTKEIDLYEVSQELRARGLSLPVLLRFPQILQARINELCSAFTTAIGESKYNTTHTPIYPIKVNQQRTVVEHILSSDQQSIGLEVGSKTEMLGALGLLVLNKGLLICNGYKDRSYIRIALYAQRMGIRVFIVIEKLSEFALIEQESSRLGITPNLGVRVRLNSIAAGNWQNTGGRHAKFGLGTHDLIQLLDNIKTRNCDHWLRLLHFHMGSQISKLQDFTQGLSEAMRIFGELHASGINIGYVDVGGGLAIDYSAKQDASYFSKEYTVQAYARSVVYSIGDFCSSNNLPTPNIFTENGRAMTAHHAVLVTNVVAVDRKINKQCDIQEYEEWNETLFEPARQIANTVKRNKKVPEETLEAFHELVNQQFLEGKINLRQRAQAECFLQNNLAKLERFNKEGSDAILYAANKYYCNFSIFQSMPDIWGLKQIFPIVPLTRLDEQPTEDARLHDLTCDSDGQIPIYTNDGSLCSTLGLHPIRQGEVYMLGFFFGGGVSRGVRRYSQSFRGYSHS